MRYFHYILTIILALIISFILSSDKKNIKIKIIIIGLVFQFLLAIAIFKVPLINTIFSGFNNILDVVVQSTNYATTLVFGKLANPPEKSGLGYILAFQGFPILITISALSSVLTHWKILPLIINFFSFIFKKMLNINGTLGFAVSVNIFSGMSETPLIINSFLKKLTHSEIFSLIVCGTSTISGSVMALYSTILKPVTPNPLGHIIASVLISTPGSLVISRIMIPETLNTPIKKYIDQSPSTKNTLDAVYIGIINGGKAIITILVMLIGFISLIDIINQLLSALNPTKYSVTMQVVLGWIMYPVAWVIGIPVNESATIGSLLAMKIILNEIIAFQELANISNVLSYKTNIMAIYALCSFANLGSIGVIIGVYSALIPERKAEIMKLGFKAVLAGILVNLSTTSIVGSLI